MRRRLPIRDPRTVARDIPGLLDQVFPRLSGGLVSSLNKKIFQFNCATRIPEETISQSPLQKSLLFEVAVARAEMTIQGDGSPDWETCIEVAVQRQRRHFDAAEPDQFSTVDRQIAQVVADNLTAMLRSFADQRSIEKIAVRPVIPGFGWIGTGVGDFAIGDVLVEVKNTDRNFIANDYRQVLLYWMLAYAASIENNSDVWGSYLLLNSRLNRAVFGSFDKLSGAASGGLSRVEIFEFLRALIIEGSAISK